MENKSEICCMEAQIHMFTFDLIGLDPWHSSIDHRNYFQTSKDHVIIEIGNNIPTHWIVAYESVHSLARGHVIRMGQCAMQCQL